LILLRFYAKIDHLWIWQIEKRLGNYTKPEKIPFTYFLGFFQGSQKFLQALEKRKDKKVPLINKVNNLHTTDRKFSN